MKSRPFRPGSIRHSGRVIKIVDRARQRVLGIYRTLPGGGGRLSPIDKKQLGRELSVPPGSGLDANDGDLVESGQPLLYVRS